MQACFVQLTLKIFISLATLFFLPACIHNGFTGAPPTLKIGLVAPFEGLHRPLGYEALFGVKLALQEQNRTAGYRVELVALNDFDDPVEAQTQAGALVADPDVIGVVGHLSSATTLAAMPVYQEAELAMSIPWSIAADPLTRRAGVVNVAASYPETAAHLARVSQTMGFSQMLELSDPAIPPIPDDIQALVLATDGVTAGEIILALHQAHISAPLFGQVEVGSPQLLQVAKGAANGLIFASPGPDPRHVADTAAFVEAYQALAGFPPGPRAVLAYDATHVLLDAIAQIVRIINRPPTRSEVSAHIGSVQRHGLSGDITFDLQGQRRQAPVWMYQISDELYPGVLLTP